MKFPQAVAGGYLPVLHTVDFTGDRLADPLVVADTGGSGGIVNGTMYAFSQGRAELISFPPVISSRILAVNSFPITVL